MQLEEKLELYESKLDDEEVENEIREGLAQFKKDKKKELHIDEVELEFVKRSLGKNLKETNSALLQALLENISLREDIMELGKQVNALVRNGSS